MAFGGVATGSMNANDVETVTGSIRYKGLTRMLVACIRRNKHDICTHKKMSYKSIQCKTDTVSLQTLPSYIF